MNIKVKKFFAVFLLVVFITTSYSFCIQPIAAADSFERSISDFPASYKPQLRRLHSLYPKWKFVAFETGIDWDEAVKQEQAYDRSLFPLSCSDIYKSKEIGDYNYDRGSYIQKDGGFVTANKAAVAYYMDPRNFLDAASIFQFESLEYSDEFDEDAVEFVLKGSYMSNTKISYLDSNGKTVKTSKKYSTAICEAGKKNNVNPCYLASKIINEVGLSGSASVFGSNKNYPGIYNFYNVGASDGKGAIERGLKWASTGTTYSRPWNTPMKSITGGAEFIAESYIAEGQFTPYLQKFNVNPKAGYRIYDHQYMTNVCGAVIQAYSSYQSYKSSNLLGNSFVFSIPVFNNMDDENGKDGSISLADSKNQTGTIANSGCNVRKGPSTSNAKYDFQPDKGTKVQVLGLVSTDSSYYYDYLSYPYWYKIKFTYNSRSYTGYMPQSFIKLDSSLTVPVGIYNPGYDSDSGKKLRLISFNEKIATIQNDYTVLFKTKGIVSIAAYDSTGRMSIVQYGVADGKRPDIVTGIKQSSIKTSSYTLSWNSVREATGYTVYRYNSKTQNFDALKTTAATKLAIKSKTSGQIDTYIVKALKKVTDDLILESYDSEPFMAATKPQKPTFSLQSKTSDSGYTLNWSQSPNANGYQIQVYDENGGSYSSLKTTTENKLSVTSLGSLTSDKYRVRAYIRINGKNIYSDYSAAFTASTAPSAPKSPKVSAISATSYTISWKKVSGAEGYRVYRKDEKTGKYTFVVAAKGTSVQISGRDNGSHDEYVIRSYITLGKATLLSGNSAAVKAVTKPAKVKSLKQSSTKSSGYTLSWKAVSGADGYCVYRYDSAKKKYVRMATVTTNKYVVKNLKAGKSAQYKVRAFAKLGNKTYYGSYSDVLKAVTAPAEVQKLQLSKNNGSKYTVKWSKASGADGYRVFRYNSKSKKYVCIDTVTKTSATIKAAAAKGSESLYIKAYIKNGKAFVYGNRSPILKVKIK